MSGVEQTNRLPAKFNKRRAKTRDGKQDQRLKALEQTVFQSLERKSKTVNTGIWHVSETGNVVNNSNSFSLQLTKGLGAENMLGNKINLLNQTIYFNLHSPDPIADQWNKFRMLVVEPREGTESLSLTDVLQYMTNPSSVPPLSAETAMASPYTTKTSSDKRYKVHYDRVFEINANNHSYTGKIKIKYGKNGKVVNFPSVGGANNPTDHNLHIMMFSDSSAVPHLGVAINIRSNFYDA